MKKFFKMHILKSKHKKNNVIFLKNSHVAFESKFEGYNVIGKNSVFSGNIGYASYVGDNCAINAKIGKYCSIASRVHTVSGKHPTKDWVSTHPAFFSVRKQCGMTYCKNQRFSEFDNQVIIGNDVWIGDSASILSGVCIGDGAIIAAGAVVTSDVPPYSIVGGVPAKMIRKRFDDETIQKLLEIKWWDKPKDWIQNNSDYFNDISVFLENID